MTPGQVRGRFGDWETGRRMSKVTVTRRARKSRRPRSYCGVAVRQLPAEGVEAVLSRTAEFGSAGSRPTAGLGARPGWAGPWAPTRHCKKTRASQPAQETAARLTAGRCSKVATTQYYFRAPGRSFGRPVSPLVGVNVLGVNLCQSSSVDHTSRIDSMVP